MAICEIMPDSDPALVVIDTLARSMGAGDENTAKDAAMFVRNCDLIREATGAHVMVIHHTGKDEEEGRDALCPSQADPWPQPAPITWPMRRK